MPLIDELAPILASPYVSPDPMSQWYYYDGADISDGMGENWHDEDQNLVEYADLEVSFAGASDAYLIEVYDRDLVLDDYAGWDYLDRDFLRAIADCGPYTYIYTDREMEGGETRLRAIGLEVESW